jgi:hypothetical protein
VPSVARLQREEMSTTQEEGRETGTFSTGIYGGRASSVELANVFDLANHTAKAHKSTGSTACFKTHGNCMVNLIVFIDNGAPFDTSGAYIAKHIPHSQM